MMRTSCEGKKIAANLASGANDECQENPSLQGFRERQRRRSTHRLIAIFAPTTW
jgi:hypothetical protein